ncbi:hypothetical protein [Persephonella sp.]|nr:hypothetical protein [Aquificota bacterium]
MRYFLFLLSFFVITAAHAGEIEDACKAYVSILDSCDVSSHDCEAIGKALEKSLIEKKVDPKTAHHFYKQCVKICDLPEGSYKNIRDDIEKACVKSLKE